MRNAKINNAIEISFFKRQKNGSSENEVLPPYATAAP